MNFPLLVAGSLALLGAGPVLQKLTHIQIVWMEVHE